MEIDYVDATLAKPVLVGAHSLETVTELPATLVDKWLA